MQEEAKGRRNGKRKCHQEEKEVLKNWKVVKRKRRSEEVRSGKKGNGMKREIKKPRKNRVFYYNPSNIQSRILHRHLASAIRRFLTASQFRCFAIATRFRHFWRHLASAIRRFLTASQFRYFSIATRFSTFVTPSSECKSQDF